MLNWFGDCMNPAPVIILPDVDFLVDVAPTLSGGHTHVGFYSESGTVHGLPVENLRLTSMEFLRRFGAAFVDRGYTLGGGFERLSFGIEEKA